MKDTRNLSHPVILFDGVCNLCSSSVQFVIKHDPKHQFHFASLQSEFGQQVLQQFQLPPTEFGSFILLENNIIYTKSAGALQVVKKLNGLLPSLYIFVVIPCFILDSIYNWIAKNRYRWFGKKEACWIPTQELNSLFIE